MEIEFSLLTRFIPMWIEISGMAQKMLVEMVALFNGAWIETNGVVKSIKRVVSLVDTWIEINNFALFVC